MAETSLRKRQRKFIRLRRIYLSQFDNLRKYTGEIKKTGQTNLFSPAHRKKCTMNFYPTYEQATAEELFLIEGSCGTLEISLQNGSANSTLSAKAGDRIIVA